MLGSSNTSLQKQLSDARLKHARTESNLARVVARLERLHNARQDCELKLKTWTSTISVSARKTRSMRTNLQSLDAEIVRLDRYSDVLERDARAEEALSAKLVAVRAGVKKDIQQTQRLLVASAQKLSNLSIQAGSAEATLDLIVESARTKAEQLTSLHRDIETLEAVMGAKKS